MTDISWAQILLVEAGAIFQIAAAGVFLRNLNKPEHVVRGAREAELAHSEEVKCRLAETPVVAKAVEYERKIEGVMEDVPADIPAGELLRTAKVSFKQVLKAHKDDRPFVPGVRW